MASQSAVVSAIILTVAGALPAAAQRSAYRAPITVSVVNRSSVVTNADAEAWTRAIQRQVHEHLAPVWKVDAEITFRDAPADGDWICAIEDDAPDSARLLGVHHIGSNGAPACVVYAGAPVPYDAATVSRSLSHEILEMLVDPWLSNVTFAPSPVPDGVTVYLREICDPVASTSYDLDGVALSDFTVPEFWFPAGVPTARKLDYAGIAAMALTPAPHGYMLVRYISPYGGIDSIEKWNYIWGSYCVFGPC